MNWLFVMLCGNPTTFAIESGITKAYERLSFLGLGFFVIHIGGYRYGVYEPDATMLACSFGEVEDRIARRGTHTAPFATEIDGGQIADACRDSIYAPDQENAHYFGIPQPHFSAMIYQRHLEWAPDGDEAFDDSSHVLQFDVGERVRLIGFTSPEVGYHHAEGTLSDIWLEADEFYAVLQQWRDAFQAAWKTMPKIAESDDGAENKY